jgi:hypothetical protein
MLCRADKVQRMAEQAAASIRELGLTFPLIALVVDAPSASFDVLIGTTVRKRLPIKGVLRRELPLDRFSTLMIEQARSEEALLLALRAQWTQRGLWGSTL